MLVKPAPGVVVRDPRTKLLVPETGIEVPDHDLDFNRLLRDGDVVVENAKSKPDRPRKKAASAAPVPKTPPEEQA